MLLCLVLQKKCFLKTRTNDTNHKKMTTAGIQSQALEVNHLNGSARSWFHERFALHTQESHTVHGQMASINIFPRAASEKSVLQWLVLSYACYALQ
jgi:hypothetical protein